ncbi:group 8 mite allergen-like protein [Dermatophagoides farinae]|uniref:glutathione transferase n=1 Tax=Dermatophagoides farinae TaxID=6954 RepID=A0A9D4NUD0_DERFA|nr:group 8 mite allergen-like protein [Dermatophagoides farinae]
MFPFWAIGTFVVMPNRFGCYYIIRKPDTRKRNIILENVTKIKLYGDHRNLIWNWIFQILTILRYLAKKHNLAGQTEKERTRIDLLEQQLRDYRNEFIEASTNKNFEKARLIYLARLPEKLRALSSFLKERPFFCGNSLSYVDFMAYEYIDQHHYLSHELFEQYGCQNLVEYLQRIEALPTIKEYQYSQDYIRHPSGLLVAWYEAKFFSTFNRSVSDKPTEQLKQEIEDTNSSSDVEQDMYLV